MPPLSSSRLATSIDLALFMAIVTRSPGLPGHPVSRDSCRHSSNGPCICQASPTAWPCPVCPLSSFPATVKGKETELGAQVKVLGLKKKGTSSSEHLPRGNEKTEEGCEGYLAFRTDEEGSSCPWHQPPHAEDCEFCSWALSTLRIEKY